MAEANVKDTVESAFLEGRNVQARFDIKTATQLRELHHERKEQPLITYANVRVSVDRFINEINPASYKPFHLLKRALLNELKLGSAAEGRYILVRVLEPGFVMCGWSSVIDDEKGVTCEFVVHNYPTLETFCVGTVLVIKEPYLQLSITGNPSIRCDCPTDIMVLRKDDSFYKFLTNNIVWKNRLGEMKNHETIVLEQPSNFAGEDWRCHGEQMLQGGNLALALECFLLASKNCSSRSAMYQPLHSQLCTVYFQLGYYEKAITIWRLIPNDENAMNVAGKAYYSLRKYKDALTVFESLVKINERDFIAHHFWMTCKLRVKEQNLLSIDRLATESYKNRWRKLDQAEYTGLVDVVSVPIKGRGVVLTEDVDAYTILIISKAFVSYLNPKEVSDLHYKMSSRDYSASDLEIITEIALAITKNPDTFGPMIYDLRRAYEPNNELEPYLEPSTRSQLICDVRRIEAIYRNNRFFITAQIDWEMKAIGAGLFIYPSYLNHSCEPNVYATFYNDVMVIRSMRQMRKGEELLINYVPVDWPFEKRLPFFADREFMCYCQRCKSRI